MRVPDGLRATLKTLGGLSTFWWHLTACALLATPIVWTLPAVGVAATVVSLALVFTTLDLAARMEDIRAEIAGDSEDARAKLEVEIAEMWGRVKTAEEARARAVGEVVTLRLRIEAMQREKVQ